MTGYIYLIRNTVNGKGYVGQTTGPVRDTYWDKRKVYMKWLRNLLGWQVMEDNSPSSRRSCRPSVTATLTVKSTWCLSLRNDPQS